MEKNKNIFLEIFLLLWRLIERWWNARWRLWPFPLDGSVTTKQCLSNLSVANNGNASREIRVTQNESSAVTDKERRRALVKQSGRSPVTVAPKSSKCKRAERYRWMGAVSQRSKLNLFRSVIAPYLECHLLVVCHRYIREMIFRFNTRRPMCSSTR